MYKHDDVGFPSNLVGSLSLANSQHHLPVMWTICGVKDSRFSVVTDEKVLEMLLFNELCCHQVYTYTSQYNCSFHSQRKVAFRMLFSMLHMSVPRFTSISKNNC